MSPKRIDDYKHLEYRGVLLADIIDSGVIQTTRDVAEFSITQKAGCPAQVVITAWLSPEMAIEAQGIMAARREDYLEPKMLKPVPRLLIGEVDDDTVDGSD